MVKTKTIKADEKIIIDAPIVELQGIPHKVFNGPTHWAFKWNVATPFGWRVYNILTNPIRYILFGRWRI